MMTEFVHLKESYIQKWKFAEKFTQAIQDVNECFFIGTYLDKYALYSLSHLWIIHETPNSW